MTEKNRYQPPSGELIAHYDFEGNVNDRSGNGHDGTLEMGASVSGGELVLDGVYDFVEVENHPDFEMETITLSAWVYPEDFAAGVGGTQGIVGKGMSRAYLMYLGSGGILGFDIITSGGRKNAGKGQLVENAWQHIAVTYNGFVKTWYLNGDQVGIQAFSGELKALDKSLIIGSILPEQTSRYPEFFKGKIDEVKIWDYALSADEIMTEYQDTYKLNLEVIIRPEKDIYGVDESIILTSVT